MKAPGWVIWIALILSVVATLGVYCYAVSHYKDDGLIRDNRTGCMRVWDQNALPLPVFLEKGSSEREGDLKDAIQWWNDTIGIQVFAYRGQVDMLTDKMPVTVQEDARFNGHGECQAYFAKEDYESGEHCSLRHMEVRLLKSFKSNSEKLRESRHELGHALGLGHDERELRVMNPELRWTGDDISDKDLGELRKAYAE